MSITIRESDLNDAVLKYAGDSIHPVFSQMMIDDME